MDRISLDWAKQVEKIIEVRGFSMDDGMRFDLMNSVRLGFTLSTVEALDDIVSIMKLDPSWFHDILMQVIDSIIFDLKLKSWRSTGTLDEKGLAFLISCLPEKSEELKALKDYCIGGADAFIAPFL